MPGKSHPTARTLLRTIASIAVAAMMLPPERAEASDCAGRPNALGTSRVMTIDPREFPRIGTMQYMRTLPLEDKEVVLTFDDGPMPPYTNRVLDILSEHCVRATYFVIGRMARGYPELIRRILADGHVIGTHSENHVLAFDRMQLSAVQKEIEQGISSVAATIGHRDGVAPFFRIPGLLRAPKVEGYLQSRGLVTWSADITGDDWKNVSASEVVRRIMDRLADKGRGIVLLHDIQPATALALPELLRAMKSQGYRIVHVVPHRVRIPAQSAAPDAVPVAAPGKAAEAAAATAPSAPALANDAPVATFPVAAAPADAAPVATVTGRKMRRQLDPDHAMDSVASAVPPGAGPASPARIDDAEIRTEAVVEPERSKGERSAPQRSAPAVVQTQTPVQPSVPDNATAAQQTPASISTTSVSTANVGAPTQEPALTVPSATVPATALPAATIPAATRPVATKPVATKPAATKPVATRPSIRTDPGTLARPLSPGLKPPQGAKTPGKIDVPRIEAPPNVVSVPVPRAGGVGVSALAQRDRTLEGRFQLGH